MTERFPDDVADVLTDAGWTPERRVEQTSEAVVERIEGQFGADLSRTESFPAAIDALREFVGLTVLQDGPGADLRRRSFVFDPVKVAATTQTLTDFGGVIGTRLFPLGFEGDHDAILAIAEDGHVFSLDHTGEYHLGDTLDEALVLLVRGQLPPRVDDAGNWQTEPAA